MISSYISLQTCYAYQLIGLVGRVFVNGPGDLGSIPGHIIPKTLKMVLDTSLLNTQHYKVHIIGFIPFPRVLVLCEMQSVASRIWTCVAVSISCNDNHYTTDTASKCCYYCCLFCLVGRVFANGPGDLGSIPGHVIPMTLKMVLDTSLLNIQHYEVCIKGEVEQSREKSSTLPYTLV